MNSKNIIIIDENDRISIPGHTSSFWAVAMVDGDTAHVVTGLDRWSAPEVSQAMADYDGSGELSTESEIHTVRTVDADDIITELIDGWFDGFWHWCRDTADETAEHLKTSEGRLVVVEDIMDALDQMTDTLLAEDVMREAVTEWVGDGSDLLAQREEAA